MPLTPAGLELPTTLDTLAQIEADEAAALGDDVETGPSSPLGQLNAVVANQVRVLGEGIQAVYSSLDPDQATGAALDRVCALTGTYRRPATRSLVDVEVELADGALLAPGQLALRVAGDPGRVFRNVATLENPADDAQPIVVTGTFEADLPGPVEAPAGTLTELAEPAPGYLSSTNPDAARLGLPEETDAQLRLRRVQELSRRGTSTPDAIRIDVIDAIVDEAGTPLLRDVIVFENTSNLTNGDGLPPHSIEVLAWDGTDGGTLVPDADIALAVWRAKPAGIETYGTTTETVQDARGDDRTVRFSRPTAVPVEIEVTIEVGPEYVAAVGTAVQEALAAYAQTLRVGDDVVLSRLYCPIFAAARVPEEIYSVTLIRASRDGDPLAAANVVIGPRELATLDAGDVTILTV